jgi:hypothetical protein
MLPGHSISVVGSPEAVPEGCSLVGPVSIGLSDPPFESNHPGIASKAGTPPEALKPDLLDWAKRIARDWDGDVLAFRTVVEKRPESAAHPSLWCECQVYRCTADSSEQPAPISLVALLANPESHDGQLVSITAWAAVEYELAALFLNRDDKAHLAFESAVRLDGPESLFTELPFPYCGYLEVEGRFSTTSYSPVHYGGYLAVHRLNRIEPYQPEASEARRPTSGCS